MATTMPRFIRLPARWPGQVRVRGALTVLRVAGHWAPWLDEYARSSKYIQRVRYPMFRQEYYELMTGLHPDGARRIGK